jgi:hypothetical protein
MEFLPPRDYELYSLALKAYFGDFPPLRVQNRTGLPLLTKLDPDLISRSVKKILRDNPELVLNFESRNLEPAAIENRFSIPFSLKIVRSSEEEEGWLLSRIGYSKNRRFALLMITSVGRPKASYGMMVLCQRIDAKWKCKKIGEWMS